LTKNEKKEELIHQKEREEDNQIPRQKEKTLRKDR